MFADAFLTGELDLRGRQLKEFPLHFAHSFDIRDLIAADLSLNRFTTLPPLDECHSLERLELRSNALRTLPAATLLPLHSLTFLDLSNNQLAELPAALFNLPRLKVLLLNNNRLEQLPTDVRHLADSLEELDLAANRLRQIPPVVSVLTQLRVLNLRANQLTSIPAEIGSMQLRILDLSANLLIRLPTEFHRLADSCVDFRTDGNPLLEPPTSVAQRGRAHVFKWLLSRSSRTRPLNESMGASVAELKLGSVEPAALSNGALPSNVLYTANALGISDFACSTTLNATMRRTERSQQRCAPDVRRVERRSRSIRSSGARCTDSGYLTGDDHVQQFESLQLNGNSPDFPTTTADGQARIGALAEEILRTFEETRAAAQSNGNPPAVDANRLMDLSNNNVPQQTKRPNGIATNGEGAKKPQGHALTAVALSPLVEMRSESMSSVRLSATSVEVKLTSDRRTSNTSTASASTTITSNGQSKAAAATNGVRKSPLRNGTSAAAAAKRPKSPAHSRPSTAASGESSASTTKRPPARTPPPANPKGKADEKSRPAARSGAEVARSTSRLVAPRARPAAAAAPAAPASTIGKSATLQRPAAKKATDSKRLGSTLSLASVGKKAEASGPKATSSRPAGGLMAKSLLSARVQPVDRKEPLRTQNGQPTGVAERKPPAAMSRSTVARAPPLGATKKAASVETAVPAPPKDGAKPPTTAAALIAEMRACLSTVLGDAKLPAGGGELAAQLADGVLLCAFLNAIRPNAVPTVIRPSTASALSITRARRNVESFVGACREIGVPEAALCHPSDVLERKNLQHTAKTVLSLRKRLCS
ncbi:Calponin-homology (CH) domain-containing protein [Aphelenchoides fujianensis]|nr:Calponin-homology (CH) domain-containing protein [Aphelenchoides fujianensis]